jgi:hypothetical protein
MTDREKQSWPTLFNGLLETGVRAIVILDAAYPRAFDLAKLSWFDHFVVHTADINGPESLHPDLPQRSGELLVRRRLIEASLDVMQRLHLIDRQSDASGIRYRAGEDSSALVGLMRSDYHNALKARASWLIDTIGDVSDEALRQLVSEKVGKWHIEFQEESSAPGALL